MARTTPWPVDVNGRLAPLAPVRGLAIQRSGPGLGYVHYRVTHRNPRTFTAQGLGRAETRLLAEWGDWLDSILDDPAAVLTFHLPSCAPSRRGRCSGCDASALGRGPVAAPAPSPPGAHAMPVNTAARDARILRAAREVLREYTLTRSAPDTVRVKGGTRPYRVTVDPLWVRTPTCTCPDHARPGGPWCKHIIAALLQEDGLRCQLLELFLA